MDIKLTVMLDASPKLIELCTRLLAGRGSGTDNTVIVPNVTEMTLNVSGTLDPAETPAPAPDPAVATPAPVAPAAPEPAAPTPVAAPAETPKTSTPAIEKPAPEDAVPTAANVREALDATFARFLGNDWKTPTGDKVELKKSLTAIFKGIAGDLKAPEGKPSKLAPEKRAAFIAKLNDIYIDLDGKRASYIPF